MLKYALFDYVPNRKLSKASFELQDLHRMILGFKDGRNLYTGWAARMFARALSAMDLSDTVIAISLLISSIVIMIHPQLFRLYYFIVAQVILRFPHAVYVETYLRAVRLQPCRPRRGLVGRALG